MQDCGFRLIALILLVENKKWRVMNRIEKISVARVVSDLIKADSVIDSREMQLFSVVKSSKGLNKDCLCDARFITFADAVNNLSCLEVEDREDLMNLFKKITLADGMCNKDEALLMIALMYCLEGENEASMVHVQVPQQGLQLKNSQVIYVESSFDAGINEVISDNHHQIENAMRLAGFDFAYIPQIAKIYRETPSELFHDVLTFLTPNLNPKELEKIHNQISSMTTIQFCKEQLNGKLHLPGMTDTYPALLVKVGETVSENSIFSNFLKVDIEGDVLEEIKHFIYKFTSMMNAEYSIIKNVYNDSERFIYSGVYKQIMDLCLMKENTKSTILIDPINWKIKFPEINEELKITRSEKALYVLVLAESITGGLNFNGPVTASHMKKHKEKMNRLMRKYSEIYRCFGGDVNSVPNILEHTIRGPKIARINKSISSLEKKLTYPDEYKILRDCNGLYKVAVDSSLVYCIDRELKPWMQSEDWRRIVSL